MYNTILLGKERSKNNVSRAGVPLPVVCIEKSATWLYIVLFLKAGNEVDEFFM